MKTDLVALFYILCVHCQMKKVKVFYDYNMFIIKPSDLVALSLGKCSIIIIVLCYKYKKYVFKFIY